MIEIRKTANISSQEIFESLGYVKEITKSGIERFLKYTEYGFESINTSQIQTNLMQGKFWTTVGVGRRINAIEEPMIPIAFNYNVEPTKIETFRFRLKRKLDVNETNQFNLEFEISKNGILEFQNFILNNHSETLIEANKLCSITSIDKKLNSQFSISKNMNLIMPNNIPVMIRRLVISKLAGNDIWNEHFNKIVVSYENALKNETSSGFKKIFEMRIQSLKTLYPILVELKPLETDNILA